ncbi:putative E3 ubiquitin-protein ligase SINA-like 6 [Hordeum vulgare subsp. vulgare]|nr:putative E3 ubiquitin-protein ligase SINA-like 6 [Hordeum vulgare subsp. vulgare]
MVHVEAQLHPVHDVASFLIFEKSKATELLDCHACHLPLQPPIFACDDGHLMCSSCRGAHGEDCGRVTAHCRLADAYAGAVKLPCDYVKFGCEAGLIVCHDASDHRRACQYAPCYCPECAGPRGGDGGCDFSGSRQMLLDHISTEHSRPILVVRYGQPGKHSLPLTRRWHVFVGEEDMADLQRNLFLVVLDERDNSTVVSLVCVRADDDAPGAPQFSYKLAVEHTGSGARVTLELPVMTSNFLPGGTPWPDEVTSLSVPKAYLSGGAVPVTIHIDKHVPPPPPPRPPSPPAPATATVFKFTATDQGSKKRKSTNPRKL